MLVLEGKTNTILTSLSKASNDDDDDDGDEPSVSTHRHGGNVRTSKRLKSVIKVGAQPNRGQDDIG